MRSPVSQKWNLLRNLLFLLAIVTTVYFGFFDYFKPPFKLSSDLRGPSDRNLHILALATVTVFVMLGQKNNLIRFCGMLIFASMLEFAQLLHPTRVAAVDDLVASLVGVLFGASLAVLINISLLSRLKRQG